MAKREVLLQSVAAVIFGLMCFAFFRFVYPSGFFQKEQAEGLFTLGSFVSYLTKPAWLVCYSGNVLMAFGGAAALLFISSAIAGQGIKLGLIQDSYSFARYFHNTLACKVFKHSGDDLPRGAYISGYLLMR